MEDEVKWKAAIESCVINYVLAIINANRKASDYITPKTIKQAIKGEDKDEWLQSIWREINNLIDHGTFAPCKLPPGVKPLTLKWVFKVKAKSDGTVDSFKSRR